MKIVNLLIAVVIVLSAARSARSEEPMIEAEVLSRMIAVRTKTGFQNVTPYWSGIQGHYRRHKIMQTTAHVKAPAIARIVAPAETIDAIDAREDCVVLWRSDRQRSAPTRKRILEIAPETEAVDLTGAATGQEISDRLKGPLGIHARGLQRSPAGKAIRDQVRQEIPPLPDQAPGSPGKK